MQNSHRAQPDGDHDPQGQIKPHQRVALEAVFGKRIGGHGGKQQHQRQGDHGHDQAVLKIAEKIALLPHRLVPGKAEGFGAGQTQRITKNRPPALEGIDDDQQHRRQSQCRVATQNQVNRQGASA